MLVRTAPYFSKLCILHQSQLLIFFPVEPCAVDEKNVSSYNIEMKWKLEVEEQLYLLSGDIIEFVCKPGYFLPPSTGESELLVQCNNGKLKYPKCISRGKTIFELKHFKEV